MESAADALIDITEIHVGSTCHVQTPESRFGAHVLEDLKAFVYEAAHASFAVDDDDDDEDEEDSGDEDDEGNADAPNEIVIGGDGDDSTSGGASPQVEQTDTTHEGEQQSFPRMARLRCNLTAMSQRYNLYFAAYQDKIYVFQPKKAPQILPPPSLILSPKRTRAARMVVSAIDRSFGHQMNSIIVGDLGHLEVVYFAFDDGDVGAYYTHAIEHHIMGNKGPTCGSANRQPVPKEFFHENVGSSAWGLAIHKRSRLLGVSSNAHEVTVFAFATNSNPIWDLETPEDSSPKTWSGLPALELEKHFQSRSRTWRIILPTGIEGRNIPSICFCDDESGCADKVVACDIDGNTWILDIWKIGSFPVLCRPTATRAVANQRYVGWGVLALPDSSFRQCSSLSECLGLPTREIIPPTGSIRQKPALDVSTWLDTTCRLFYIRGFAPEPDSFLRFRHYPLPYAKIHNEGPQYVLISASPDTLGHDDMDDDEDDSDGFGSDTDLSRFGDSSGTVGAGQSPEKRWAALCKTPGPLGSLIKDIHDEILLSRVIVPSLGQTPPLEDTTGPLGIVSFSNDYLGRHKDVRSVRLAKAEFSPHLTKNLTILRTTTADIELQPFDPSGVGILCRGVLGHHNHFGRRNEPWDLQRHISERASMLLHVPELNLVVVGALNGRVALLTLTKTTKRFQGLPVRRGFRVDWVLPRRSEEQQRMRPLCALHGIAISPVPDPKAQGLDLHRPQGRLPPIQYRLILHYVDHTILMYDIARREGDDDLMIF